MHVLLLLNVRENHLLIFLIFCSWLYLDNFSCVKRIHFVNLSDNI